MVTGVAVEINKVEGVASTVHLSSQSSGCRETRERKLDMAVLLHNNPHDLCITIMHSGAWTMEKCMGKAALFSAQLLSATNRIWRKSHIL